MPLSLGSQPKRYGQVTSTIKVPRRRAAQVTGVTLAPLLLGTRHPRHHLLRPDIHTRGQPHCAAQDVPVGQNGAQPAPGPHARNPTGFLSQVLERPATHRRLTSPAPRLPGGAGAANSRRAVSTQSFMPLAGAGTAALATLSPAAFPLAAETARQAPTVTPEHEFRQGLAILLQGLSASLAGGVF